MPVENNAIFIRLLGRIGVRVGSADIRIPSECALYLAYRATHPQADDKTLAQTLYPDLSLSLARARVEECWETIAAISPRLAQCDEIQTDVAYVQQLLGEALASSSATRKKAYLSRALGLLEARLLPGHSAAWIDALRDDLWMKQIYAMDSALHIIDATDRPARTARIRVSQGFIGRAGDLRRLLDAWKTSRLVTIVADGGLGKTRLAVEATRGKVPLVNLANARNAADLIDALRGALNLLLPDAIRSEAGQLDALAAHLPPRLILDNAEGLEAEALEVVEQLLQRAPKVRFLVTSRSPISIPGELIVPLRPLSRPAARRLARVLIARQGKACSLHPVAVAKGAGGSPLALEIAVGVGALPQLAPRLQELLAGLATFAASWSEDEAREVLGDLDGYDLEQLVDARLIGRAGSGRQSMLVPVREAARRLATRSDLQEAHATYFEALAHRSEPEVVHDAHVAELTAALEHFHATGQAERAASMAVALTPWARQSGRIDTVEGWLQRVGVAPLTPRLTAEVADALGRVLFTAGRYAESLEPLRTALRFWERAEELPLIGRAAGNLGLAHRRLGELEDAERHTRRSVEIFRALGDSQRFPAALTNLGQVLGEAGRWQEAADAQREAVAATTRQADFPRRQLNLAETLLHVGENGQALAAIVSSDTSTLGPHEEARAEVLHGLLTNAMPQDLEKLFSKSKSLGIASSFFDATLVLITDRIGGVTLP